MSSRFKEMYKTEVVPALIKKFNYKKTEKTANGR